MDDFPSRFRDVRTNRKLEVYGHGGDNTTQMQQHGGTDLTQLGRANYCTRRGTKTPMQSIKLHLGHGQGVPMTLNVRDGKEWLGTRHMVQRGDQSFNKERLSMDQEQVLQTHAWLLAKFIRSYHRSNPWMHDCPVVNEYLFIVSPGASLCSFFPPLVHF